MLVCKDAWRGVHTACKILSQRVLGMFCMLLLLLLVVMVVVLLLLAYMWAVVACEHYCLDVRSPNCFAMLTLRREFLTHTHTREEVLQQQ
jgi:uncharacterized BrkB/YihY/UPF0761 family membrane protein